MSASLSMAASVTNAAPSSMNLTLDSSHTYRIDGVVIPSVTSVLREAGIIDYSMIPQEVLQAAARRGTAVHRAMQLYALDSLDMDSVDPAISGYVQAGIKFFQDSQLVVAHVEQMVYHPKYRYAGTYDLDCVINDELWLIDYKTGILLDGHAAQLAAYLACRPHPRKWRRANIQLNEDGSYRVHQYARADYDRDFDLFLFALNGAQKGMAV